MGRTIVEPDEVRCPLPRPEPTDKVGSYFIREGSRFYQVQVGAIATDEQRRVWRLVEQVEARWELDT